MSKRAPGPWDEYDNAPCRCVYPDRCSCTPKQKAASSTVRDAVADYYARQEREASEYAEQLRQARERKAPAEEIRRLERLLEQARYVGD